MAIDIAEPLAVRALFDSQSETRDRDASLLVRIKGRSIGVVNIDRGDELRSPADAAAMIFANLAGAINEDLLRIGCAQISALGPEGLVGLPSPAPLAVQPPVTILVATRDRTDTLDPCLQSLLALDYPTFDIVVVDSAPGGDETADLVASRYAEAPVRYLREQAPGLAIAHNAGLEHITAPIVAITDDDVVVNSGWLKEIVRQFNRSPRIACVTGLILPLELETPAQDLIEQFGGFARGFSVRTFSLADAERQGPLFPYTAGVFGSGANMAFRRSTLLEIGGFDPALGAGTAAKGGDDLAAFFDIIAHGYELAYTPDAVLWHRHRRDYDGVRRQAFGYGVGLGAYLTGLVVKQPMRLLDMMRRMPKALHHLIAPTSPKNQKKRDDYPAELTRLERVGLLRGPFCYGLSRWKTRQVRLRQRHALHQRRVAEASLV